MNEHVFRPVNIGYLCWETGKLLQASDAHLLRGFVISLLPDCKMLHNHAEDGKEIYRYPKIQYKIVHGTPMVVGIGEEAIGVLQTLRHAARFLQIGKEKIPVHSSVFETHILPFGISPVPKKYVFLTPCILLNAENYAKYSHADLQGRMEILSRALIGNFLSTSKGVEYTVPERIQVAHDLTQEPVCLKGQEMIGFKGLFTANFHLPNFIGIGKSPSRGYGTCMEVEGLRG